MKNLTKLTLASASLIGLFSAAPALAQDAAAPAPDWAVSAAVAVQSDYRFRGISQNQKQPAEQGTLNVTGPEGFYIGTWVSKINWDDLNHPSIEVDVYGGKHTDLWGTDLNTEVYAYTYPDAPTQGVGIANATYVEGIVQLTHNFGPFSIMGTYAYSPEFSLGGGVGNYVEGTLTVPVNDWFSLSGNVGHQWVQNAKLFSASDYTHYDVGATFTYKSLALDARYVGTDLNATSCAYYMLSAGTNHVCSGGFMATLTYNISSFPW